jgi:hypothetical protein
MEIAGRRRRQKAALIQRGFVPEDVVLWWSPSARRMLEVEGGMQHTGSGQRIAMTARVLGGLAAVMWLLPLIGELIGGDSARDPGGDGTVAVSVGVGLLATANIVAVVIAFRRPPLGGRLLLITGTSFSVIAFITAGRNEWLAVGGSGAPFLLSGALFVTASRRDRHTLT